MTCSEIAAEIGVTRNAVIGKIHRLGLSSGRPAGAPARASTSCPPRARHPRVPTQRRLLRLAYTQASLGEQATSDVSVASAHPRSLVEIAERQCRWPIGDPAAADFVFCGNDAIMGFTYCLGAMRAWRIAPRRRGAANGFSERVRGEVGRPGRGLRAASWSGEVKEQARSPQQIAAARAG